MRIFNNIKYWFQRRIRGYSDLDLMDLDVHLAELILPRLVAFRDTRRTCNHGEDFDQKLDSAILAMRLITSDPPENTKALGDDGYVREIKKYYQLQEQGLKDFAHIFEALWD